ncbi:carboxypeptidase-like regulatory domain-containing protein [Hymenobacter latericus]|uniref:carboxypeptidase-like regulatory domain-containing protein n=1 Tax=Hymenobacter sp. YIM 151858-1 TaxID=2987688 RepID=UPI002226122E|nr:carboxypeptidase-like regulatory domain-containing protein [Hymenobacter sp. YIM 151858-1]UYZ58167.1 carboxypeptidase-like regulatory domain-containing protein [Hymenobacter sp. YIM 151858-1]
MSRLLPFACVAALLTLPLAATAQHAPAGPQASAEIIAAKEAPTASAASNRLDCGKVQGQVLNSYGQPLIGATVMLAGSKRPYITDGEGRYQIAEPVYRGQQLRIEAAGYIGRYYELHTCEGPVVGLELAEGTKVKRSGKRAGQIVRSGQAYRQ